MGDQKGFLNTAQQLLAQKNISQEDKLFIAGLPLMLQNCQKYRENVKVFHLMPDTASYVRKEWSPKLAETIRSCKSRNQLLTELKGLMPWSDELLKSLETVGFITYENGQPIVNSSLPSNSEANSEPQTLENAITAFYTHKLKNTTFEDFSKPANSSYPLINGMINFIKKENNDYYKEYNRYIDIQDTILQFQKAVKENTNPDGSVDAFLYKPLMEVLTSLIDQKFMVAYGMNDMNIERRRVCDQYFPGIQTLAENKINENNRKNQDLHRTYIGKPKGTFKQENTILESTIKNLQILAMRMDGTNNKEIYGLAVEEINSCIHQLKNVNCTEMIKPLEQYRDIYSKGGEVKQENTSLISETNTTETISRQNSNAM